MAGFFTRKRMLLAAVLVAGLPYVAPYNLNTCSGGLVAQTCKVPYSSHCCKSSTYLSATCCQNSCSEPSSSGRSSTTTCWGNTNSMCCSTKSLAAESCCDYAEYSRTSTSSVRGDYLRPTYGTCAGWSYTLGRRLTEYCLNSLSTACCTSRNRNIDVVCCRSASTATYSTCRGLINTEYCTKIFSTSCCSPSEDLASVSCCGAPACPVSYSTWDSWYTRCYGTSTYCCHSSKSCCDFNSYNKQPVSGELIGGVIAGVVVVGLIIAALVTAACCPTKVVLCGALRVQLPC